MRFIYRLALVVAMALGSVMVSGPVAHAATSYVNTYDTIASTPDVDGITTAQGFAAGSTYLYSIKIRSSHHDDRSVIYRINKKTGSKVVMKNGTTGSKYNTWLGHANDMTIVDIDGKHHFFVVTMTTSGAQLVKLRYDGSTYYKVGSYKVRLKGAVKAVSGINRVSVTSSKINFMVKSGRQIYNASIPLRANSGTVNLTTAFDLKVAGALVDGKKISGLESWNNQGFFYDTAKKVLYYPLTTSGRSVVLVYRNVTPSTKGTVPAASNLTFRITSHVYPTKFEIEGIGISGGRLYFNTNRSNRKGAADGVHVFKNYVS